MKHIAFSVFLACTLGGEPTSFTGKVVGITDGDTVTVLHGRSPHKIRLEGIDAPESSQAYGTKSKQALAKLVFSKEIRVEWASRDRYGRILGHLYLGDTWINRKMVADGWAWHFREGCEAGPVGGHQSGCPVGFSEREAGRA